MVIALRAGRCCPSFASFVRSPLLSFRLNAVSALGLCAASSKDQEVCLCSVGVGRARDKQGGKADCHSHSTRSRISRIFLLILFSYENAKNNI